MTVFFSTSIFHSTSHFIPIHVPFSFWFPLSCLLWIVEWKKNHFQKQSKFSLLLLFNFEFFLFQFWAPAPAIRLHFPSFHFILYSISIFLSEQTSYSQTLILFSSLIFFFVVVRFSSLVVYLGITFNTCCVHASLSLYNKTMLEENDVPECQCHCRCIPVCLCCYVTLLLLCILYTNHDIVSTIYGTHSILHFIAIILYISQLSACKCHEIFSHSQSNSPFSPFHREEKLSKMLLLHNRMTIPTYLFLCPCRFYYSTTLLHTFVLSFRLKTENGDTPYRGSVRSWNSNGTTMAMAIAKLGCPG